MSINMGDHRRECAVYAPWRISRRKIRITVRMSTSGRVPASYYLVRFDNGIMSKKRIPSPPQWHTLSLLSDIAVEFQSYPSMKWKPAQFEVCVVQQVSRVDVDCCLPLRHLYCAARFHTNRIPRVSHDKTASCQPRNKTNQNNSSWTLNSSST
jgi:hypothetical protein